MRATALLLLALLSAAAAGQGSAFQTPGQPASGQVTRFSNEFNPALGVVLDAVGDYSNAASGSGFDLSLRALELDASAWIDPSAWLYVKVIGDEESITLEEAAAIYQGFENDVTIKAGRFYVDFGKQMQAHVHDLRTLERPAVLREYLGEELPGSGLQVDDWHAVGDQTVVRYSLAVLADLRRPEGGTGLEVGRPERLQGGDLGLTARLTGFRDVGEHGVLQIGLSALHRPSFTVELGSNGTRTGKLSNTAAGADATWGWTADDGIEQWTLGGEALLLSGDLAATVNDNGTPSLPGDDFIDVGRGERAGFYAFADYAWSQNDSAGVQASWYQLLDTATSRRSEYELYYTRRLTEFQRLRLALSVADEPSGRDSVRAALQYTLFVGSHAHGINF